MSPMPAGALPILRSAPHTSNAYLIIQQPEWHTPGAYPVWTGYLWSCQVNGTPAGDPMVSLTVDGGAAGPIALLDGMTVFIGSALGAWDYGMVRLRGDQTVGAATVTLDIGISSDLRGVVPDNAWVVVLDEFRLWQRYSYIDASGDDIVWRKDWNLLWNTLGANDAARRLAMIPPTPIMGPHAVKFIEPGGNVTFDFNWSDSHALAPGQAVTSWVSVGETDHVGGVWNDNVENPVPQVYSAISGLAGFRVTLTVDDGNGVANNLRQRRGVRYVFTLRRPGQTQAGDPPNAEPITEFQCESITGSFSQGYWRTTVIVYGSQASEYQIIPGALVILFAEDWYYGQSGYLAKYGANIGSIGPIRDRENILMVGVIARGTISQNPETGDVSFEVMSIAEQATITENIPMPITDDTALAYTDWIHTPGLTTDIAIRYYLAWQTTLANIADTYPTGDSTSMVGCDFPNVDIYSAVDGLVRQRLLARFLCDRFGRFACVIDQQVRAPGIATTLWALEYGDWTEQVQIIQQSEPATNIVEAGGVYYDTAADTVTPYLSQAPGLFYRRRGSASAFNNLAVTTQLEVNTLCGRMLAYANNEFPELRLALAGNWRVLDIWPQEYIVVTLSTGRHEFVDVKFIPRQVNIQYSADVGAIFVSAVLEMETDGPPGVTIPIPDSIPTPIAIDPPRVDVSPTMPPTGSGWSGLVIAATNDKVYWANLLDDPIVWTNISGSLSSGYHRCWKLVIDRFHWSSGSGKLWGLFGSGDAPYHIYSFDFPSGLWTLRLAAGDFAGSYPRLMDIIDTEVANKLYAIRADYNSGVSSVNLYCCVTMDGGLTWSQIGTLTSGANLGDYPAWPYTGAKADTAPHSGTQWIGAHWARPAVDPLFCRSENSGVTWAICCSPAMSGVRPNGVIIPYHDASWNDTMAIVWNCTGVGTAHARRSDNINTVNPADVLWMSIGIAGYYPRSLSNYTGSRLKWAGLFKEVAGAANSYIYTSEDAGDTWTLWKDLGNFDVSSAGLFIWGNGGTLEAVVVHDLDNNEMLLVTVGAITDVTSNLLTVGPTVVRVSSLVGT